MSWQTYVDNHLMCDIEGNHLSSAAIVGHDGSVWAQSSSFPQVNVSLAMKAIKDLMARGLIRMVSAHANQQIYTGAINT